MKNRLNKIFIFVENGNYIILWPTFLLSGFFLSIIATCFPFLNINIGSLGTALLSFTPFLLLCIVLFFRLIKRIRKKDLTITNFLLLLTILVVTGARFIALFYIIKYMYAPILHDVIDHSLWAKDIMVTERINFFYSPLLHALTANLSLGHVSFIPKVIVIVTHLAVLMIPIQYSLLFHYYVKNTKLSILLFIILSSLHFPASLYFTAGKNSLILALSIIPINIYMLNNLFKKNTLINAIGTSLSFILLFFAHYPTLGIVSFLAIPWIGVEVITSIRKKQYGDIIFYVTSALLFILPAILWFKLTYHIQEEHVSSTVLTVTQPSLRTVTLKDLYINLKEFLNQYIGNYFNVLYVVFLIPILSKNTTLKIKLSTIWFITSLTILYTLIYSFKVDALLGMVPNTLEIIYKNSVLIILLFLIGYLLNHIKTSKSWLIMGIIVISIISIFSNYLLYKQINTNQQQLNVVSDDDIGAYNFINNSLPKHSIFLNGAIQDPRRTALIFPVDGAMWIPLYTDSEVVFDFQSVSSTKSHDYYKFLLQLKEGQDDEPIIKKLKDEGIFYGYVDRGVFGESFHDDFLNSIPFETLYEKGSVKIIRFK